MKRRRSSDPITRGGWRQAARPTARIHVGRYTTCAREEGVRGWDVCSHCLPGSPPRIALVLVWIFTNLVDRAFDGFVIPLLGLIFFPYATLFFVLAYNPLSGGLNGWGWFFVVIGFIFDIGHWIGGGVTGRHRYAKT